jgi:hypothetical protein
MPPPKLPLTTIAEHDPIYPYQTLLVLRSLLAMTVPASRELFRSLVTGYACAKYRDFLNRVTTQASADGLIGPYVVPIRVHFQYRMMN